MLREPQDEFTALADDCAAAPIGAGEPCQLSTGETCGLRQVTLGNGLVRAEILLDKGASVRQFWHVPKGMRTLAETSDWKQRLTEFADGGCIGRSYSDCYEGGWQDVLPARARWDGGAIGDADGIGEAAVVRWELVRSVCTPAAAHFLCRARLPRSELEAVKRFSVRRGLPALRVDTAIRNAGQRELQFSWTQHPALGGDLLDDSARVLLPGGQKRLIRQADGGYADAAFDGGAEGSARRWVPVQSMLPATPTDSFETFAHVQHCDAALLSTVRGVGVRLRWDVKAFPHAWIWCAQRAAIRCIAVEPSSTYLPELASRPQPQLLHVVRPAESMRSWIELSSVTAAAMQRPDSEPSLFGCGWS